LNANTTPWYSKFIHGLNQRAKYAIVASPIKLPGSLGQVNQLFELRKFVRSAKLRERPYFPSRYDLYEHIQRTLLDSEPVDYLEFGVFTGSSMKKWVALNQYTGSRFFGFDTFEGLPERWEFATGALEAGYFSTGGKFPDIPDQRVQFLKGLFQDTLSPFLRDFQPQNRLIIHCDADLYTSTLYVLATLNEFMQPGTVVIFDEFGSVNHEFRAFMDYTASFQRKLTPIAWSGRFYEQVAFMVHAGSVDTDDHPPRATNRNML
jgi:O-methyltransferase